MLHRLRHAHLLARFVLAWFVLSIGAAVASPVFKPQSMELICSANLAIKLIVKNDDGAQQTISHTLDCPLCAISGAPLPTAGASVAEPQPLSHALLTIPAAHIAALTGAPLPARGPPALL